MRRLTIHLVLVLTPLVCAQERIVDQAYEDVDPLAESFREFQKDLRQDVGFTRLYENPLYPGWFYRRDGAVTAFMPQGDYIATRNGLLPLIPPGTIFFVGEPSPELLPKLPGALISLAAPPSRSGEGERIVLTSSISAASFVAEAEASNRLANRIEPRQAEQRQRGDSMVVADPAQIRTPALMREDLPYRAIRLRDIAKRAAQG